MTYSESQELVNPLINKAQSFCHQSISSSSNDIDYVIKMVQNRKKKKYRPSTAPVYIIILIDH